MAAPAGKPEPRPKRPARARSAGGEGRSGNGTSAGNDGGIVVKQVRSAIGAKPRHRGTLRALGLGRIGRTAHLPDRPEIRGMITSVTHLVEYSTEQGERR